MTDKIKDDLNQDKNFDDFLKRLENQKLEEKTSDEKELKDESKDLEESESASDHKKISDEEKDSISKKAKSNEEEVNGEESVAVEESLEEDSKKNDSKHIRHTPHEEQKKIEEEIELERSKKMRFSSDEELDKEEEENLEEELSEEEERLAELQAKKEQERLEREERQAQFKEAHEKYQLYQRNAQSYYKQVGAQEQTPEELAGLESEGNLQEKDDFADEFVKKVNAQQASDSSTAKQGAHMQVNGVFEEDYDNLTKGKPLGKDQKVQELGVHGTGTSRIKPTSKQKSKFETPQNPSNYSNTQDSENLSGDLEKPIFVESKVGSKDSKPKDSFADDYVKSVNDKSDSTAKPKQGAHMQVNGVFEGDYDNLTGRKTVGKEPLKDDLSRSDLDTSSTRSRKQKYEKPPVLNSQNPSTSINQTSSFDKATGLGDIERSTSTSKPIFTEPKSGKQDKNSKDSFVDDYVKSVNEKEFTTGRPKQGSHMQVNGVFEGDETRLTSGKPLSKNKSSVGQEEVKTKLSKKISEKLQDGKAVEQLTKDASGEAVSVAQDAAPKMGRESSESDEEKKKSNAKKVGNKYLKYAEEGLGKTVKVGDVTAQIVKDNPKLAKAMPSAKDAMKGMHGMPMSQVISQLGEVNDRKTSEENAKTALQKGISLASKPENFSKVKSSATKMIEEIDKPKLGPLNKKPNKGADSKSNSVRLGKKESSVTQTSQRFKLNKKPGLSNNAVGRIKLSESALSDSKLLGDSPYTNKKALTRKLLDAEKISGSNGRVKLNSRSLSGDNNLPLDKGLSKGKTLGSRSIALGKAKVNGVLAGSSLANGAGAIPSLTVKASDLKTVKDAIAKNSGIFGEFAGQLIKTKDSDKEENQMNPSNIAKKGREYIRKLQQEADATNKSGDVVAKGIKNSDLPTKNETELAKPDSPRLTNADTYGKKSAEHQIVNRSDSSVRLVREGSDIGFKQIEADAPGLAKKKANEELAKGRGLDPNSKLRTSKLDALEEIEGNVKKGKESIRLGKKGRFDFVEKEAQTATKLPGDLKVKPTNDINKFKFGSKHAGLTAGRGAKVSAKSGPLSQQAEELRKGYEMMRQYWAKNSWGMKLGGTSQGNIIGKVVAKKVLASAAVTGISTGAVAGGSAFFGGTSKARGGSFAVIAADIYDDASDKTPMTQDAVDMLQNRIGAYVKQALGKKLTAADQMKAGGKYVPVPDIGMKDYYNGKPVTEHKYKFKFVDRNDNIISKKWFLLDELSDLQFPGSGSSTTRVTSNSQSSSSSNSSSSSQSSSNSSNKSKDDKKSDSGSIRDNSSGTQMDIMFNIVGALETGGQVYGQRDYANFINIEAGAEQTATLGWSSFYGVHGRDYLRQFRSENPDLFAKLDTANVASALDISWEESHWEASPAQKAAIVEMLTTEEGKKLQDTLTAQRIAGEWAEATAWTDNMQAVAWYTNIAELAGSGTAQFVFDIAAQTGDFSLDNLYNITMSRNGSSAAIGAPMYHRRHALYKEWIEEHFSKDEKVDLSNIKVTGAGLISAGKSSARAGGANYSQGLTLIIKVILSMSAIGSHYGQPHMEEDYFKYCIEVLDHAMWGKNNDNIKITYIEHEKTVTAETEFKVLSELHELEEMDTKFHTWDLSDNVYGDKNPQAYIALPNRDFEEIFNVKIKPINFGGGKTGKGGKGGGSNLSYIKWAIEIAEDNSHGYAQDRRGGDPDYDCSSFIFYALKQAGFDLGDVPFATFTMKEDLEAVGFTAIPYNEADLQVGDILLHSQEHCEIYIGDGQTVGAHVNENGDIVLGQPGDQTGQEISVGPNWKPNWQWILRPPQSYLDQANASASSGEKGSPEFGSDGLLKMQQSDKAQGVINLLMNIPGHSNGAAYHEQWGIDSKIDELSTEEAIWVLSRIENPGFGQTGAGLPGIATPETHKAFVEQQLNTRFGGSIHELLKHWGTYSYTGY